MSRARLVPELLCSDLDASLAFYIGLAGFSVLYERPEDRFAYLNFDGAEIMLEELPRDGKRVWLTADVQKPFGRGINFEIQVADADAIQSRMMKSSWPLFQPMEERWYRAGERETGNRQFLVQDPDGYLLRFFSDLGTRPAA